MKTYCETQSLIILDMNPSLVLGPVWVGVVCLVPKAHIFLCPMHFPCHEHPVCLLGGVGQLTLNVKTT